MIVFSRTATIAPGKAAAAWGFATKIVDFYKNNYDQPLELLRPLAGHPGRIAWVARYKDLAAFEAVATKSQADPKYLELIAGASDLFIAGSAHDELWRNP